jgi:hypothetical protein
MKVLRKTMAVAGVVTVPCSFLVPTTIPTHVPTPVHTSNPTTVSTPVSTPIPKTVPTPIPKTVATPVPYTRPHTRPQVRAGPPQHFIRQFGNYRPYQYAHVVLTVTYWVRTFVQDVRLSSKWRAKKKLISIVTAVAPVWGLGVVYMALCIGLFRPFVAKRRDVWGRQEGVTVVSDRAVMGG